MDLAGSDEEGVAGGASAGASDVPAGGDAAVGHQAGSEDAPVDGPPAPTPGTTLAGGSGSGSSSSSRGGSSGCSSSNGTAAEGSSATLGPPTGRAVFVMNKSPTAAFVMLTAEAPLAASTLVSSLGWMRVDSGSCPEGCLPEGAVVGSTWRIESAAMMGISRQLLAVAMWLRLRRVCASACALGKSRRAGVSEVVELTPSGVGCTGRMIALEQQAARDAGVHAFFVKHGASGGVAGLSKSQHCKLHSKKAPPLGRSGKSKSKFKGGAGATQIAMDFNMRSMRKQVQSAARSASGQHRDFEVLQRHSAEMEARLRAHGMPVPPRPRPVCKRARAGYKPAFQRRKKKGRHVPVGPSARARCVSGASGSFCGCMGLRGVDSPTAVARWRGAGCKKR